MGNLVAVENTSDSSKNWTYDYDPFSRLVCAENDMSCSGSGAITFALDALDRAVTRTKDSTATTYRYRGVGEVPAKTTTGGTSTRYANTLAGEPIAQRTGSTTRFFLKDMHGDTVGLVNTLAQDRMSVAFDPWGELLGQSGSETTWFGFQSDPTDPATGQVDMGTRWYEGGLGRFTSRDVLFGDLNDPESLNQFAYAIGAPATFVDPTGMKNAVHASGGPPLSIPEECQTPSPNEPPLLQQDVVKSVAGHYRSAGRFSEPELLSLTLDIVSAMPVRGSVGSDLPGKIGFGSQSLAGVESQTFATLQYKLRGSVIDVWSTATSRVVEVRPIFFVWRVVTDTGRTFSFNSGTTEPNPKHPVSMYQFDSDTSLDLGRGLPIPRSAGTPLSLATVVWSSAPNATGMGWTPTIVGETTFGG